jgi:hypothetical protein
VYKVISYDEWHERYRPVSNHIDSAAGFDGTLFETSGEEEEHVMSQADSGRVWTLLESDDTQTIAAGFHRVNRLGYFITEEPCTDDVEVSLDD